MSEDDWGEMLDLDVVVLCSYEQDREELPWCHFDHKLRSVSIVSLLSLQDQVKIRNNRRKQWFGNFCTNVTHFGILKWVNQGFLSFVKAKQIRVCLLGCVHETGSPESGGGESNPPQSQGWGMLISYFWVKKRKVGEPIIHHAKDCLFGLDCLNPQLTSCLLNQEWSPSSVS